MGCYELYLLTLGDKSVNTAPNKKASRKDASFELVDIIGLGPVLNPLKQAGSYYVMRLCV